MEKPSFKYDWIAPLQIIWPNVVFPQLPPGPLNWLELGSLEGRSAIWLVEKLLRQRPGSKIYCVDLWKMWPSPDDESCYDYEAAFDSNTRHEDQIVKCKGLTSEVLPTLTNHRFHGCYIDASHEEEDVLHDARHVFPLMLPGGIIVFDDYRHPREAGVFNAVQTLLVEWHKKVEIIYTGYQIIFKVVG